MFSLISERRGKFEGRLEVRLVFLMVVDWSELIRSSWNT